MDVWLPAGLGDEHKTAEEILEEAKRRGSESRSISVSMNVESDIRRKVSESRLGGWEGAVG